MTYTIIKATRMDTGCFPQAFRIQMQRHTLSHTGYWCLLAIAFIPFCSVKTMRTATHSGLHFNVWEDSKNSICQGSQAEYHFDKVEKPADGLVGHASADDKWLDLTLAKPTASDVELVPGTSELCHFEKVGENMVAERSLPFDLWRSGQEEGTPRWKRGGNAEIPVPPNKRKIANWYSATEYSHSKELEQPSHSASAQTGKSTLPSNRVLESGGIQQTCAQGIHGSEALENISPKRDNLALSCNKSTLCNADFICKNSVTPSMENLTVNSKEGKRPIELSQLSFNKDPRTFERFKKSNLGSIFSLSDQTFTSVPSRDETVKCNLHEASVSVQGKNFDTRSEFIMGTGFRNEIARQAKDTEHELACLFEKPVCTEEDMHARSVKITGKKGIEESAISHQGFSSSHCISQSEQFIEKNLNFIYNANESSETLEIHKSKSKSTKFNDRMLQIAHKSLNEGNNDLQRMKISKEVSQLFGNTISRFEDLLSSKIRHHPNGFAPPLKVASLNKFSRQKENLKSIQHVLPIFLYLVRISNESAPVSANIDKSRIKETQYGAVEFLKVFWDDFMAWGTGPVISNYSWRKKKIISDIAMGGILNTMKNHLVHHKTYLHLVKLMQLCQCALAIFLSERQETLYWLVKSSDNAELSSIYKHFIGDLVLESAGGPYKGSGFKLPQSTKGHEAEPSHPLISSNFITKDSTKPLNIKSKYGLIFQNSFRNGSAEVFNLGLSEPLNTLIEGIKKFVLGNETSLRRYKKNEFIPNLDVGALKINVNLLNQHVEFITQAFPMILYFVKILCKIYFKDLRKVPEIIKRIQLESWNFLKEFWKNLFLWGTESSKFDLNWRNEDLMPRSIRGDTLNKIKNLIGDQKVINKLQAIHLIISLFISDNSRLMYMRLFEGESCKYKNYIKSSLNKHALVDI